MTKVELAWNSLLELRKETLESQRIRSQIIGVKITFISASMGVIIANLGKISASLFLIPSFAAIFFDYLINSYSFSIKRIGFYILNYLEPVLKAASEWDKQSPLWEEYMNQPENKQSLSMLGGLGITFLTVAMALYSLYYEAQRVIDNRMKSVLFITLLLFLVYDICAYSFVKIRQNGLRTVLLLRFKRKLPETHQKEAKSEE